MSSPTWTLPWHAGRNRFRSARGRTPGVAVCAVLAGLLALLSVGLLTGGGALLWADGSRVDGYVTTGPAELSSPGSAITADRVVLGRPGVDRVLPSSLLGEVRVRVRAPAAQRPVFVGIGRTADVARYLAGVHRTAYSDLSAVQRVERPGGAAAVPPAAAAVWAAQVSGTGEQILGWRPGRGPWTAVVMNADGSAPVLVRGDLGATAPALGSLAAVLLAAGLLALSGAAAAARAASRA